MNPEGSVLSQALKRGRCLLRLMSGSIIREVAREKTDLSEDEIDKLLDARKMTEV